MPRYNDGGFIKNMLGEDPKVDWLHVRMYLAGDELPPHVLNTVELALARTWYDDLDFDDQYIIMDAVQSLSHKGDIGHNSAFRLCYKLSRFFEAKGLCNVQKISKITAKQIRHRNPGGDGVHV